MLSTTEDTIRQYFSKACGNENAIERVKKLRDYAFVHFKEREDGLKAMDFTNSEYYVCFINAFLARCETEICQNTIQLP